MGLPNALSYSAISEFDQCRLKFKYHRIDKVPEPEGAPLIVGQKVHEVLEGYVAHLWREKLRQDVEKVPELLEAVRGETPVELFDEVAEIVTRYTESHTFDPDLYQDVQVELKVAVDDAWEETEWFGRDVHFRGVVDLLLVHQGGELVEIVDYKTGHRSEPESVLESSLQVRAYRRLVKVLVPRARTVRVSLDFVRVGRVLQADFDADDPTGVEETVAAKLKAVRAEKKWSPRVSSLCGWCGYKDRCPAFQKAAQLAVAGGTPAVTPENALEVARKVRLAEAWISEAKEALKVHVEEHGPVVDPETEEALGFQAQDRTTIADVEGAVVALLEAGVPKPSVWKALGLSKTAIERLARKVQMPKDQREALLGLVGKVTTTSVFRWGAAS